MDRNLWWGVRKAVGSLVALRKESVDRNFCLFVLDNRNIRSLSARRAWIEISMSFNFGLPCIVALRKESVDRNGFRLRSYYLTNVALRKESVDRNYIRPFAN